jgi:endonuclease/exonuclease/phosphatase (EEP) superfamily protein YafD
MALASYQVRIAQRFSIVTVLLLSVTVFSLLATQYWFFELFSHFTPLYALLALLVALALGALAAWRWMALALAIALWNGYPVVQALTGAAAPRAGAARAFTVFHFNVGLQHEQTSRIVSYLQRRAKDIDVVALFEVNNDFDVALEDLKDLFPYQVKHLEDSPFGIALASKYPLDLGAIAFIPSEQFPHVEAAIKLPGRTAPLALYAIHAPPPVSAEFAKARNGKLEHVARLAAAQPKATPLVVGDFNVTPWSPYFKRFADTSGLRVARTPRRFEHTWPVTFENASIGLAIDHSFAHPALRLIKRTIGPDLGSDHLPVTVTFGY